jgi:hypothetical protein
LDRKGRFPMRLNESLASVARSANPGVAEDFRRHIDPAWVEEALEATGTATVFRHHAWSGW